MANKTGDLATFIKNNRRFIKLEDGDTFTGIFLDYKVHPSRFDPEKEVVSYIFQHPDSDGKVMWENGSTSVAQQMMQFSKGETLQISRKGSGPKDTKYEVHTV